MWCEQTVAISLNAFQVANSGFSDTFFVPKLVNRKIQNCTMTISDRNIIQDSLKITCFNVTISIGSYFIYSNACN